MQQQQQQQPLFAPFRALGYITDGVPFAVQRRGKEAWVTVSVGKCWQVWMTSLLPARCDQRGCMHVPLCCLHAVIPLVAYICAPLTPHRQRS